MRGSTWLFAGQLLVAMTFPLVCCAQEDAGDADKIAEYNFDSKLLRDLGRSFSSEGPVEQDNGVARLKRGGTLKWENNKGSQFRIEFHVAWPEFNLEAPIELEIKFVPQGLQELGVSSIGAGPPCGVTIRSLRLDGKFYWEILHQTYRPDGRRNQVVGKQIFPAAAMRPRLRVAYNYGAIQLDAGDSFEARGYVNNHSAGIKEIHLACLGQPLKVSNIQGRGSVADKLPSFADRLRLLTAAGLERQSVNYEREWEFAKALELQLKLHAMCRKILGEKHIYTLRSGERLAWLQVATGDLDSADENLGRLIASAESLMGPDHLQAVSLREELAQVRLSRGDWASAESIFRETHQKRNPKGLRDFEDYLNDVAEDLRDFGRLPLAKVLRERAVGVTKKKYPAGHSRVIKVEQALQGDKRRLELSQAELKELQDSKTLQKQLDAAYDRGNFPDALEMANRLLEVRTRLLGRYDRDTAVVHTFLGLIHKRMGKLAEAEEHYEADLEITRTVMGNRDPEYGSVLNNFGQLYVEEKEFEKAEKLLLEAVEVRKAYEARYPDDYAESLSNLGRYYCFWQGAYEKGIPLIEKSYHVRLRRNASDSVTVARSLINLGHCYRGIRDYQRAAEYFRRSLNIRKKAFGEEHINYASTLLSLGTCLADSGQFQEGIQYIQRAREITERVAGKNNSLYPQTVNYLAAALSEIGEDAQARELYREALALRSSQVGQSHGDCGEILANIAKVSAKIGELDQAIREIRQAKTILVNSVGQDNHRTQMVKNVEVSILLKKGDDLDYAYKLNEELLAARWEVLKKQSTVLSESQQLQQFESLRHQLFKHLELGRAIDADPYETYRYVLNWKSVIASRSLSDKLSMSSETAPLRAELRDVRRRLSELIYSNSALDDRSFLSALGGLEQEKERLQRQISLAAQSDSALEPKQLAVALPEGCVLLDFLRVAISDGKSRYHVFAVFREGDDQVAVRWFDLGVAAEIDLLVTAWRGQITKGGENENIPQSLASRIWKPVLDGIGFKPRYAYICPDSALTAVPWAALPGEQPGSYLLHDVIISMLPFAQYLLLNETQGELANGEARQDRLLIVGNLDYRADVNSEAPPAALALRSGRWNANGGAAWDPLPGTAKETAAIAELANQRHVVRLEKADATVPKTMAALQDATYAHFASHGFFGQPTQTGASASDEHRVAAMGSWAETLQRNPFLLSGIVLSGASQSSRGAHGLLTAEAIASLPLQNMRLVTLSACETGLGQLAGGEGVYGLQRAFHLAGSQHVTASLWKVEDRSTAALMELFYAYHWRHKLPPAQSLRLAQLELLRRPELLEDPTALSQLTLRGPSIKSTVAVRRRPRNEDEAKNLTIRQWAAFFVSGSLEVE